MAIFLNLSEESIMSLNFLMATRDCQRGWDLTDFFVLLVLALEDNSVGALAHNAEDFESFHDCYF